MDSKVVLGIIGVLVIGLGVYGYSSNQKEGAMMEQKKMEEEDQEDLAQLETIYFLLLTCPHLIHSSNIK